MLCEPANVWIGLTSQQWNQTQIHRSWKIILMRQFSISFMLSPKFDNWFDAQITLIVYSFIYFNVHFHIQ